MAAVPGGAGVAMTVIGSNKLLNQVFQNTPPVELRKMNTEKLNAMGVHPEVADAFINNTIFSPREQTLFVHALGEMNGVADRGALVRLALSSQNFTVALFRQRQAQMYAGYNKSVTPLASFISSAVNLPRAAPPMALWFSIFRRITWSGPSRWPVADRKRIRSMSEFPGTRRNRSGSPARSARGRERKSRAAAGRFAIAPRRSYSIGSRPILITRSPKKEWPSGLVTLNMKSVALGVGGSWGDGVLNFQGRDYPFSISGLSLVDVGISNYTGAGKVYDLSSPADLAGNYAASQATFAIAGGDSAMSMKNDKWRDHRHSEKRRPRVRHAIEHGTCGHEDHDEIAAAMSDGRVKRGRVARW